MLRERKYCLLLLLALACHFVSAQDPVPVGTPSNDSTAYPGNRSSVFTDSIQQPKAGDSLFWVREIYIKGNKRTRREIILREIPFKPGQRYLLQDIVRKFEDGRRQLMNTALFHTVIVAAKSLDGYAVDVMVDVKERWYIFPVPYFKPVDRNLNQWLIEQKASLSRVNYGAKLLYNNVTGRNDKLRFWAMNGYTKQLSFSYDRMYIDKKMKWGMNISFATGKNKEMNYNTVNNKQVFLKDERFVRSFTNMAIEATYRKAIKTRHRFGFAFSREQISDTIFKLNPNYFNDKRQVITFPELYYSMAYYDLDYIPYPTKGYAAEGGVSKRGFNSLMNVWQLTAKGFGSWRTGKRSFISVGAFGVIKAPFKQPYYNQRMLGYGGMTLQGYEYYVVDGVAAGYLKSTFTRKLFNFNIKIPGGKKREPLRIPFTFYGKVFGNTGYVHNPQPGENFLADKMLYSGGIGIDIFSLYDITFKLEWSFNQLGQNGIFLHRNSIF